MFLTDLVAIFVIIECLYFRLSLSMFLFLLVYLVYYFALFDNIGTIYNSSQFSSKVEEQLDRFSEKEKLLENEVIYESFIDDQKEVESAQTFFAFKAQNILILKHDSRKRIWKYSAFLSVTCLILTYASQFLISDFYINNISFSGTKTIEIILFILGINSGSDFGDYVYFYYVMLIINIIEKLTIYFSEKLMSHEHQISEEGEAKDAKRLPTLENPDYLINCYISENFIRERTGM
jgi:ABC-type multidrug transport system fused ATPase/permease subunit